MASAAANPAHPARARLETLAFALLDAYRDAEAVHRVQIPCLSLLSPERQDALRLLERALVAEVSAIIAEIHPHLAKRRDLQKPITMSFFAMLNWHYLWHREDGPPTRQDYARMVATLIAEGTPAVADALAPALEGA